MLKVFFNTFGVDDVGRGGIASRKAIEERQARAVHYRLTGVQVGSIVAECLDPYRRWHLGHRLGVIARNSIGSLLVRWEGDETYTHYTAGDARYKVDTNLWRISQLRQSNVFDALSGEERRADSLALTRVAGCGSIGISPPSEGDAPPTEEETPMAATKQQEKPAEAPADALKERDSYTAKQIATRIGTDPKTLRKFFRSPASTVEPVGQGGRYEFDASDLPKIREEFERWKNGKVKPGSANALGKTGEKGAKGPRRSKPAPAPVDIEEDDEDLELDDDPEEPTDEELDQLEDIVLDLDDEEDD